MYLLKCLRSYQYLVIQIVVTCAKDGVVPPLLSFVFEINVQFIPDCVLIVQITYTVLK